MAARASFQPTGLRQIINEVAMPLIARYEDGEIFVGGTAFVVGVGWALTAFHVVSELLQKRRLIGMEGEVPMPCKILSYLSFEGGNRLLPLEIARIWRSEPGDLALLALKCDPEIGAEFEWTVPPVRLLPPRKGTPIAAYGFTKGIVSHDENESYSKIGLVAHTATGTVVKIHHEQRDAGLLNFPCFRTDARFGPGMSGGPVIDNSTGEICGVVCSSFSHVSDEVEDVSYAASIWPLAGISVDCTETTYSGGPYRPARDLLCSGEFRVMDLDKVRVTATGDDLFTPEAIYPESEYDAPQAGFEPANHLEDEV